MHAQCVACMFTAPCSSACHHRTTRHRRRRLYLVTVPRLHVQLVLALGSAALVWYSNALLTLAWALLLGGWAGTARRGAAGLAKPRGAPAAIHLLNLRTACFGAVHMPACLRS